MKALLAIVGAVLLLDAFVAVLMVLGWAARGHAPDFWQASVHGVASMVMVFLKLVGGVTAAVLLFRLKPAGRVIAGVVLVYNVLFTLYAAVRAGRLGEATVLGTLALNVALLVIVALPAAGEACRVAPARPRVNVPTRASYR